MSGLETQPEVSTAAFLERLAALDIRIEPDGERVRLSAPKGALTEALRSELSRRKQEVLKHLAQAAPVSQSLNEAPLSSAQQRLWFLQTLEPESSAYNLGTALRLRGALDLGVTRRVIEAIVQRHDVLRIHVELRGAEPVQVVAATLEVPLPTYDLSAVSAAERERLLHAEVCRELQRPFDLALGPLIRVRHLRLADEESLLVLTLHHVVADGWSVGVFMHEFSVLYAAFRRAQSNPLPALRLQYLEFARRQRQAASSLRASEQLAYWKQKLLGAPPVLELACDRPRPATRGQNGALYHFELPKALMARLRELAKTCNATPFMLLFAGFALLVRAHSGAEDAPIGVPFANRSRRELEPLIGFFVDTLVLRADLRGNPTVRELIARVRTLTLEAHAHQDTPFEQLVEALQPQRSASHSPVFQVLFAMQAQPKSRLDLSGLEVEFLPAREVAPKVDLALYLNDEGEGEPANANFEFDRDLFDADTVALMAARFEALLGELCTHPDAPIAAIDVLAASDRERLELWSGQAVTAPRLSADTLFGAFELQARRTPHAIAVSRGTIQLSFAAVWRRARRVAWQLLERGVAPEARVAVYLPRLVDLPVALLGVLAAGGAYVPIDPHLPPQRRRQIAQQAGVTLLLTAREWFERARAELPAEIEVLCIEELLAAPTVQRTLPAIDPDQLAYLIFTSGSTGLPKGVAVAQRSVCTLIACMAERSLEHERAAVLCSSSLSFDVSVFEVFLPLCAGGRMVCADDILGLFELPEAPYLTQFSTVPSAANELARQGALPKSLCAAYLGGEALTQAVANEVFGCVPNIRLFDGYGPTETTVYASVARRVPNGPVTIGNPLPGTHAYVVDARGGRVGAGLPGELLLGGAGVARGYFGRPAWTAERFVPDAFGIVPGARLYRTGDWTRFSRRADLEYLGRRDHQVKLRGFRIELGEIEAALRGRPVVREACALVVVRAGEPRLVAFVSVSTPDADLEALRESVSRVLPQYMVPSELVLLDALPLNANGKVDRSALRVLPAHEVRNQPQPVVDSTPEERLVAALWSEILNTERIDPTDEFFAVGGHSLLAVRMLARLRERCELDCSLRQFFADSTVRGLARRVRLSSNSAHRRISALPRAASYPLSYAQERFWFLSLLEGGPKYLIPLCLELQGPLAIDALRFALQTVIDRHELLRCAFRLQGTEPVAVPEPSVRLDFPEEDWSALTLAERAAALASRRRYEAETPLDTSAPPLLRARVVRLEPERHVLFLTVHHLVCDGWSVPVFLDELGLSYQAGIGGPPAALSELAIQYSDFARWQRSSGSLCLREQEQAWLSRLADAPVRLELPFDHPHPRSPTYQGATVALQLPKASVDGLRSLAQSCGASLFMAALAGYALLLQRYSGQEDLLVGTPTAGRDNEQLFPLIGCFVNTLAIRLQPREDRSFRQLLRETRKSVLEALGQADYPFERLVAKLPNARVPGRAPLVQTMFVLQPPLEQRSLAGGVRLSLVESPSVEAKFDITVCLEESANEGVSGRLEYNRDVFEPQTIDRMASDYASILQAVVASPDEDLRALSWLPAADSELEGQPSRTRESTAKDRAQCAFEARARERPAAIAAVYRGRHWTYRELDRRAESIAAHLRACGVGLETVVGLCAEPCLETLAAVFGILKAGGVYLPLDPSYPRERLGYMVERARASLLLGKRASAEQLPKGPRFVALEDAQSSRVRRSPGGSRSTSANLAYMIFTSGSTGHPKGIELTHGGLCNLVDAQIEGFALTPESRVLQFASLGFDASVSEIFTTLSVGGTLVLEGNEQRLPGQGLVDLLQVEQVSAVTLPPSVLGLMPESSLPALATLIVAGEQCSEALLQRWAADRRFINAYGPSEVTVCATLGALSDSDRAACIGGPIAGASVEVCDRSGHAVPVGVEGDLLLGGEGLARGYAGDPAQTADRFRPASRGNAGARLYFSGDRARQRADGRLEFCGRSDAQLKLRGFRIEPGEVAAVLESHPAVAEAVALVREDRPGDRRLVAYVRLADALPDLAPLWQSMRSKLPAFLLPSSLTRVSEWPLTVNGKIDLRALPAPASAVGTRRKVEPRDELERRLVAIWQSTLGVGAVSVEDDFFELGGHSLLAVVLVETIRREFGAFGLNSFLAQPTIAETARVLREPTDAALNSRALLQLAGSGAASPWLLIHGADGRAVRFRGLAQLLAVERPVYALQVPDLERGASVGTLESLVDSYWRELAQAVPAGVFGVVGFSAGGPIAFELCRRLQRAGKALPRLVLLDSLAPASMRLPDDEASLLVDFVANAMPARVAAARAELPERGVLIAELEQLDFAARLRHLGRLGGSELGEQELSALAGAFRVFCALSRAAANFAPGRYDGEGLVLRAKRGAGRWESDPLLGWGAHLASGSARELDCEHEALLNEPHVESVAEILRALPIRIGPAPLADRYRTSRTEEVNDEA